MKKKKKKRVVTHPHTPKYIHGYYFRVDNDNNTLRTVSTYSDLLDYDPDHRCLFAFSALSSYLLVVGDCAAALALPLQ